MSEAAEPSNTTITNGKWKIVIPTALITAAVAGAAWLFAPRNDDDQTVRQDIKALDEKFDHKLTVVDDKLDKVATSVARIEGQLQTHAVQPARPKYANGDE